MKIGLYPILFQKVNGKMGLQARKGKITLRIIFNDIPHPKVT